MPLLYFILLWLYTIVIGRTIFYKDSKSEGSVYNNTPILIMTSVL